MTEAEIAHLYDSAIHGAPPGIFPGETYERPNWAEVVKALGELLELHVSSQKGGL